MARPWEDKKDIIHKLRTSVDKGEWDEVVKIYRDHPQQEVQGAAISYSGDTALHMAVYSSKWKIVEELIKLQSDGVLLFDERKDSPLHHLAKMGNEKMCLYVARKQPHLLEYRNVDGETPLYVAAIHGHKKVFITLWIVCCSQRDGWQKIGEYGRRNIDGKTILHSAIEGEYFDLAYQIIGRFPQYVHSIDNRGNSALHLLAKNHTAFESSSRLTWWEQFIYSCLPVEKPRVTDDPKTQKYIKFVKLLLKKLAENPSGQNDPNLDTQYHSRSTDVENPPPFNAQPKKNPQHHRNRAPSLIKCLFILHKSGVERIKYLFPKYLVKMKEKHLWATSIADILVRSTSAYDYRCNGSHPAIELTSDPNELRNMIGLRSKQNNQKNKETPILTAAKNGISELVSRILQYFPVAIHDVNPEGKNLILLAVENRQPHVYEMLLHNKNFTYNVMNCLDNEHNNALHHAATLKKTSAPRVAPDAVLQMQWEIKWYEYIKHSVPNHFSAYQNAHGKTSDEIFMETHAELVDYDKEWLLKTTDSCTLVATLIATVAFATSVSVPGGVSGRMAEPVLKQQSMFNLFAISSLVALCFSLTAAVMFLSILTSRHQAMDFGKDLPMKLLIGLTALFISIASMLVSFCGGHFFILRDIMRDARVVEYLVVLIPVAFFAVAQFPLYFKLILATFKKVPDRCFMLVARSEGREEPAAEATTPSTKYWRVAIVNEEDAWPPLPNGALLVCPPQNEILALMKTPSSNPAQVTDATLT